MSRKGIQIGAQDLIIGSTALSLGFSVEVVSIRLRRTEAQWSANIRGGLQDSDKCSSATQPLADCAFSIGLRLALEPDLRF